MNIDQDLWRKRLENVTEELGLVEFALDIYEKTYPNPEDMPSETRSAYFDLISRWETGSFWEAMIKSQLEPA